MSSKHTPGPWRVEAGTTLVWGECLIAEDGSIENLGIPVADACNTPRSWGRIILDDEKEANARLIAAAPELLTALETLEALVNTIDHSIGFCCCGDPVDAHSIDSGHSPVDAGDYHAHNAIEMARAAIAKAKGEPS